MEVGMKDTIGPLDQEALEYGSMMPEGWQTEDRDERAELESENNEVRHGGPDVLK